MLCYAKSLQSCPTLCDPRDGSTPGSSIHGIFQARVLECAVMKGWARLIDWTITPESSSGRSQPLKSHDRDSTVPTSRRPVTADGGRAEGGAMVGNALRAATGAWLCVCVCVSTPTHMHRQRRPRALLDSCCREAIPGNQNLTFPVSGPTFSVTC